nr:DUF2798 domain-containing protein [Rhizobium sp. J15]
MAPTEIATAVAIPLFTSVWETDMNTHFKRKIVFALSMGVVTTGLISFTLLAFNLSFSKGFVLTWLRSWSIAYLIVIPAILLIGPRLQAQIDRVIRDAQEEPSI